jgi:hypothetical protein
VNQTAAETPIAYQDVMEIFEANDGDFSPWNWSCLGMPLSHSTTAL